MARVTCTLSEHYVTSPVHCDSSKSALLFEDDLLPSLYSIRAAKLSALIDDVPELHFSRIRECNELMSLLSLFPLATKLLVYKLPFKVFTIQ